MTYVTITNFNGETGQYNYIGNDGRPNTLTLDAITFDGLEYLITDEGYPWIDHEHFREREVGPFSHVPLFKIERDNPETDECLTQLILDPDKTFPVYEAYMNEILSCEAGCPELY